jgi:hypothetical protein
MSGLGVRSTALAGGLLSLAALAVALGEPRVAAGDREPAASGAQARDPWAGNRVSSASGPGSL